MRTALAVTFVVLASLMLAGLRESASRSGSCVAFDVGCVALLRSMCCGCGPVSACDNRSKSK
jgi:hypothetical protein